MQCEPQYDLGSFVIFETTERTTTNNRETIQLVACGRVADADML
jgi:hypothetical protein